MSEFRPIETLAPWLERAWMDRYLARELSAAESDWFEAYVLAHPRLAAELDADEDLRLLATKPGNLRPSYPTPQRVRRRWVLPGAAAATAAALTWAFLGPMRVHPDLATGVQPAIYTLDTERGSRDVRWNLATSGAADTRLILLQIPARAEITSLEITAPGDAPARLGPLVSDGAYFSILVDQRALQGMLTLLPEGSAPITLPPILPAVATTP